MKVLMKPRALSSALAMHQSGHRHALNKAIKTISGDFKWPLKVILLVKRDLKAYLNVYLISGQMDRDHYPENICIATCIYTATEG